MNPMEHEQEQEKRRPRADEEDQMVKDPVCGMELRSNDADGGSAQYQDQTFFFCSPECRDAFSEDPARYVAPH